MRKYVFSLAAIIALAAATLTLAPTPTATGQGPESKIRKKERRVPNSYIVVLQDWAAQPFGENSFTPTVAADLASAHRGRIKNVYRHSLHGFSIELPEQAAEALSNDPRVAYVEEDGVVTASTTQTNPPWGLDRIDQRDLQRDHLLHGHVRLLPLADLLLQRFGQLQLLAARAVRRAGGGRQKREA